jgi:hypothetical protein
VVRYFANELDEEDIGDLSLIGVGLRHSISQYIPLFPVDLTIGAFWQKLKVGEELLDFEMLHLGVQASRGFGLFTLYGGIGQDQSQASIEYDYESSEGVTSLSYDFDGDNGLQFTVGAGLNLGFVFLNGDYSFGKRTAFSLGLFLGL